MYLGILHIASYIDNSESFYAAHTRPCATGQLCRMPDLDDMHVRLTLLGYLA